MTPTLRTARTLTAAVPVLTAAGIYAGTTVTPWLCLPGLYAAAFMAWCASREYGRHRRLLVRHEQARRAALGEELDAAAPCCRLDELSGGYAHGTDCMRPPDLDAELAVACCELWFITRRADHDVHCRIRPTRSSAA